MGFLTDSFSSLTALRLTRVTKVIGAETVNISRVDQNGDIKECDGVTKPTDGGAGYGKGCVFTDTDAVTIGTISYINIGSNTSCNFDPFAAAVATPTDITVADAAGDATMFVALFGAATGDLGPKTDAGISYNATTNVLTVTGGVTAALTGNVTGDVTGNVTGNVTGSSGSTTGNAGTATALQTARAIGGVNFDGTASIVPTTIVVADSADTTCWIGLWEEATGNLLPKSDEDLTWNPSAKVLGLGAGDTGKITFFDANVYIDSPADGKMRISADGAGTDDITLSGTVTIDDDIDVADGKKISFRALTEAILSSGVGQLDLDAASELEVTAPTIQLIASTLLDLDATGGCDIDIGADGVFDVDIATQDTAATAGGDVTLTAGTGNTTGAGGVFTATAGAGGNDAVGGAASLVGGAAGGGNRAGGNSTVQAGAGAGTQAGGQARLLAGTGGGTGAGGQITITAGQGGATSGAGGAILIESGTPIEGAGGAITLTAKAGVTAVAGNQNGGGITLTGGNAVGTGDAGDVTLTAGDGGAGAGTGGDVILTAGAAGGGTAGQVKLQSHILINTTKELRFNADGTEILSSVGGQLDIDATDEVEMATDVLDINLGGEAESVLEITCAAAAAGIGGNFVLTAGAGFTNFAGGAFTMTAGAGAGNGLGGDAELKSGAGSGTQAGGTAKLTGGLAGATGAGGPIIITAGAGGLTSGNGGALTLSAGAATTDGDGGAVSISSGNAVDAAAANAGGAITITAGNGSAGGNSDGGDVSITAGNGSNAGTGGDITLTPGTCAGGTAGILILPSDIDVGDGKKVSLRGTPATSTEYIYSSGAATVDIVGATINLTASTKVDVSVDLEVSNDLTVQGRRVESTITSVNLNGNDVNASLGRYFKLSSNGGAKTLHVGGVGNQTITNPISGQEIVLIFEDGNITLDNAGNLLLSGAGDFVGTANDTLTVMYDGTNWRELHRSVNG